MEISVNLIVVLILVLVVFSTILWIIPILQVQKLSNTPKTRNEEQALSLEKDRLKLEDEARKTLAQIIGGGVVLLGLLFTFGTYLISLDKQDLDREAQMTDRFSKAITHLGDEKQAIRIGGLYELERVAKDSPKDLATIRKVILTYLHDNYSIRNEATESTKFAVEKREQSNGLAISFYSSNTELQTLINIIQGLSNEDDRLDFSGLNLLDKSLTRGRYSLANFSGTNLSGSNIFASNFSHSNFKDAILNRVTSDLKEHIEIKGSIVMLVTPQEVKPNFTGADLTRAMIIESNLSEAIFVEAKLRNADLTKSIFYKVNLSEAALDYVNATQTNFKAANLTNANFRGANLSGASFEGSILDLTNFSSADLRETKGLNFEVMKKSIISDDTKLPIELEVHKKELLLTSKNNFESYSNEAK